MSVEISESQSTACDLSFRFAKCVRLLNASDYSSVFNNARIKASHPQFLILSKLNHLSHPRLGIVVAKKNVKLAVKRNRLKRLIRESFRLKQHNLPPIDAIVLARRGTENLSNDEITERLNGLWKQITKRAKRSK